MNDKNEIGITDAERRKLEKRIKRNKPKFVLYHNIDIFCNVVYAPVSYYDWIKKSIEEEGIDIIEVRREYMETFGWSKRYMFIMKHKDKHKVIKNE